MTAPENPDEKKSTVDKIIMGAIIGTAIGSAIGMTMAPKKGKETRSLLKETTSGLIRLGKAVFSRVLKKVSPAIPSEGLKKIPDEMEIIPPKTLDHE